MSIDIRNVGIVPEWRTSDRIRRAREHAGMEQDELAEVAGVARRSISRYETGASSPRRPQLIAIALATGVPVQWLETGEAPRPEPDGAPEVHRLGFEPRTRWLRAIPAHDPDEHATIAA